MSEKGFLDRWSERKRKVAEAEEAAEATEEAVGAATETEVDDEAAGEEQTDAEILAGLGLKDPDEMQAGDDFSVFLKSAVPARIRTRALRRLWASNPAFNLIDPLVEYGEDYTDAATVVENLQTGYEVGKGMLRRLAGTGGDDNDIIEKPTESVGQAAEAPGEIHSALAADAPEEGDAEDTAAQSEVASVAHGADPDPELVPIAKNNRRMRFHFDRDS